MTRLEKMINAVCYDPHADDPAYEEFEYDPSEGHYHIEPPPPEEPFNGEWNYSNDPATIHLGLDYEFSIDDLKMLHQWLDVVLEEEK